MQTFDSLSDNLTVTFELFQNSHLQEHIKGVNDEQAGSMSLLGKASQVSRASALKDASDEEDAAAV